jgi:hypothetical protein
VWVAPSQIGFEAVVQSASPRQATQLPLLVSQSGVAPVQAVALVDEHCPQAPDGWQAGVDPPHSLSPAQARQACVVVLQIGVAPPHWLSPPQPRQVWVAPPQAVTVVAEHWPQAPDGWQAGVAPPQSPSRPQPRQTWLPASQIGVVPPHCALLTQATQVPLGALQ